MSGFSVNTESRERDEEKLSPVLIGLFWQNTGLSLVSEDPNQKPNLQSHLYSQRSFGTEFKTYFCVNTKMDMIMSLCCVNKTQ